MAVTQPVISDAFIPENLVNQLQEYRLYDVLSPAYIADYTVLFFRGSLYQLYGEDGYLYTKVGFAMKYNPFIMDPMNFQTPANIGGQWQSSYMVMKGGRPIRVEIYGDDYYNTWEQLVNSYVNTVVPG
jgi:hypothetical protein